MKALVNSECIYIRIDKQLVKDKRIKMKLVDFSFEVFNANSIKNGEVTRIVPLKVGINGHKEHIDVVVMDLNRMDMFL